MNNYRLLQHVRDTGEWESWIIYMLKAVDESAKLTLHLIENIRKQMAKMKKCGTNIRSFIQELIMFKKNCR